MTLESHFLDKPTVGTQTRRCRATGERPTILILIVAYPGRKYSVLTKRREMDSQWEWEIVRDGKPLGARIRGAFKFESGALKAGTATLNGFLEQLRREERSASKSDRSAPGASKVVSESVGACAVSPKTKSQGESLRKK